MVAKQKPSTHIKELLLLFAIPVGILILVALYAYLPQALAHPKQDFVFSGCAVITCSDPFTVQSNHLQQATTINGNPLYASEVSKLYYYDASDNSTQPISKSEAQALRLDSSSRSRDGYVLERRSSGGSGFFFVYSSSNEQWVLRNGWVYKPVQLSVDNGYMESGIQFIGWVE